MKKIMLFAAVCVALAACSKNIDTSSPEKGQAYPGSDEDPIKIGDVIWAPVNCGTDADHPYGLLYQWGRKDGQGYYDATLSPNETEPTIANKFEGANGVYTGANPLSATTFYAGDYDWIKSGSNGYWNKAASPNDAEKTGKITPTKGDFDPCPEGWRVPTDYELKQLCQHRSLLLSVNGQNGYYFSGSASYSESVPRVFLPAAGCRYDYYGSALYRGYLGYYWSSSFNVNYAWYLDFGDDSADVDGDDRAGGCSVRCVQE